MAKVQARGIAAQTDGVNFGEKAMKALKLSIKKLTGELESTVAEL
jgi:hypothetical protein